MSLEAKKLGNVASLPTGFEHNATKEEMAIMREALGSAARIIGTAPKGAEDTKEETRAREIAQRMVLLHEAEHQKTIAVRLAENVRQRSALSAAAIDMWIKTFAANFHDGTTACIVAKTGNGGGKQQQDRFAEKDEKAGGCAVTPRKLKQAMMKDKGRMTSEEEWKKAVADAKKQEGIVLVGTTGTTKCTLTASTEGNYAGDAASATQTWGFFWQLTGAGTADGVTVKWTDEHKDAGTHAVNATEALNELWVRFEQLKETTQQIINLCNGQAKGAPQGQGSARELCAERMRQERLAIAKKILATRNTSAEREERTDAQIEHARTQENANATQHRAQEGAATQQNKQGGHRGAAPQTRTAASESAEHARSCRQQARGAAATLVAFLAGARNRKHAHE
ncbi:hypothetical protein ERJ75_001399600 [Trypanosoma vivax]|nr:hypothetical protein ERJ75_001399600 [Trypanosoma vivax]